MEWLHEVSVLGCHVLLPAVSCTDQSSHPGVSGLLQSFTRSPTTQPYTEHCGPSCVSQLQSPRPQ